MHMRKNKILTILLALLAGAVLACSAGAAGLDGSQVRAVVVYSEDANPDRMAHYFERMRDVDFLWRYDQLFSGAAVEASPETLEVLETLEGVEKVALARSYTEPQRTTSSNPTQTDNGAALMGLDKLWEQGYNGDGMVIAVLDSGLRTTHEAFFDYGLAKSPALSQKDIEAFLSKGGTQGVYLSERIPFAYDYSEGDGDVYSADNHGTHVAALAAGYVPGFFDDNAIFQGAAPAAQILSMKVFPDGFGGGADDAVILRALEDAWNLGADVVNLSLGISNGFTQDDVLDGIYCRAFSQMRESGVIICCAAGNGGIVSTNKTWGESLPTSSYPDYGGLYSPSTYLGSLSIVSAELGEGGSPAVADYSSMGTTSDLRLTPALTAIGGPTVSAGSREDNYYYEEQGTSMASGTAAGSFAVVLQALRERGISNKQERADLAESLMASTAQILAGQDNTPSSPRRQGAGLMNPAAAVSSDLLVTTPLLELGASAEGQFTLSFTLRNLSNRAMTAQLDTVVLTDAYKESDGATFSLLSSMDISSRVTVEGGGSVTVPARGTQEVSLVLTVSPSLREELAAVFPNGFFVEGFVTATAGEQSAHASFLGFCGDWSAAPILESADFRDMQDTYRQLSGQGGTYISFLENRNQYYDLLDVELGINWACIGQPGEDDPVRLLGENGYAAGPYSDSRIAVPTQGSNAIDNMGAGLKAEVYVLRNAAHIVMLVSDQKTGAVYYVEDDPWTTKSAYDGVLKAFRSGASYVWDGKDANGNPLPDGTQVQVSFYAWLDYDKAVQDAYAASAPNRKNPSSYAWLLGETYQPYLEWSFPVTLDGSAPTVSAAAAAGGLELTIQDNRHVAYAAVQDSNGRVLAEQTFFPETAGEAVTLHVDTSQPLYVVVEDYASNRAGYAIDPSNPASPTPCAVALLTDVDKGAWYHEAVDYVWGAGVMEEQDEPFTFSPLEYATRIHVVTALYQGAGSPEPALSAKDLPFTDVPSNAKYMSALCWAYGEGLVTGQDGGTSFAGTDSVTRQQLAAMLHRRAQLAAEPSGNLSRFSDWTSISDWAVDAMSWAVGEGLISGRSSGVLDPHGVTTRAELAQIMMRFLKK